MSRKPGYSFSALELFDSCPHAYRLIRLDKIPRAESEPLKIGGDTHKLVGDYLSRLVNTGQQTDWAWAEGLFDSTTHPEAQEIFRRFVENFVLSPMEAPCIEKKLAFNRAWQPVDWFAKDAFFRMIADFTFLQGGLAVVKDFKTNRAIIEIDSDNIPLQLRIYGWGVKRALYPDTQEVLLQLHFLRYGAEREILLAPEDLDGVPEELESRISKIEAEKEFAPTPGSFCGWCGVTSHCPVMAQALVPAQVMYPTTQDDAVKAATLLLMIAEMDKALKEHLKRYVKEFGPVLVGDMVYGPSVSTSYDLDPKEVTDKLLDSGLDAEQVWGMLGITKTSLERGLKKLKRKDLLDEILAAAPSKETEKIGFSKVKEG